MDTQKRWTLAAASALILMLVAACTDSITPVQAAAITSPIVYAHRGGTSQYVENTLDAFKYSPIRRWETDVRFTSTGVPMLLHDPDLRRFNCPTVLIAQATVTKVRSCKASNGQTANTLYEFMSLVRQYNAQAFIELKTVPTEAQWASLQYRFNMAKANIIVESFLPSALTASSARGYETGLLTTSYTTALPSGTDWYMPPWTTLTSEQVAYFHTRGIKIAVWTPARLSWSSVVSGTDVVISNDYPS